MLLVAGETVYLRNYGYKPAIKRKFKFQSKQLKELSFRHKL